MVGGWDVRERAKAASERARVSPKGTREARKGGGELKGTVELDTKGKKHSVDISTQNTPVLLSKPPKRYRSPSEHPVNPNPARSDGAALEVESVVHIMAVGFRT